MVPTVPSDWALRTDCVQLQSICSSLASPPVREDLVIEQARWLSSGSYCLWLGSFSLLSYFPFFFYLSLSHDSHLTFLSRSETLCPHQFNKYTRSPLFSLIPLLLPLYLFIAPSLLFPFCLSFLFSVWLKQLYAFQLPTKGLFLFEIKNVPLPRHPTWPPPKDRAESVCLQDISSGT